MSKLILPDDFGSSTIDPELIQFILIALIPLFIWSLLWKGLALWHSSRKGSTKWFVVFLVVNTLGILEMIYLFGILKKKPCGLFKK